MIEGYIIEDPAKIIFGIGAGILGGFILGLGVAFFIGVNKAGELRKEAIEANVAKYEVDPKTGLTKFIFIKPIETPKVEKP